MIEIDPERLIGNLRKLSEFGRCGTGVHRTAFSDEDLAARNWLSDKLAAAGLGVEMDGFGNVIGRGASRSGPHVLVGSHTDTVPRGGWLDGALGVIYGLELAQAIADVGEPDLARVDVISFQDEEGTYFSCLGSRSFVGELSEADLDAARNAAGERLRDVLARRSMNAGQRLRLDPGQYSAYLEAHIEQGPLLEAEGVPIGIVTGIVGIRRFRVTVSGQADHAGTTPMRMRRDAGRALLTLANRLNACFETDANPNTVWNFGSISFKPGAPNVVPAEAELMVEFRDVDASVLDRFEARLHEVCTPRQGQMPVEVGVTTLANEPPTLMDESIAKAAEHAARSLAAASRRMPSGAGHDAMVIGRHVPTGMIFVPSIGGRSHDISESTHEADIVRGCRVLAATLSQLLN
jgi:N-carbamoyl-L-amino-acid hydrolase